MVRALCSHRRGRGFEPLYLYQRFERRLEAIQKKREFGTSATPFFSCLALCLALRSVPISGNEIVTAHAVRLFRRCAPYEPLYLYQRFERRLEAIQKNGSLAQVPLPLFCVKFVNKISYTPLPRQTFYFCARMPYNLYGCRRNICERLRSSPLWVRRVRTKTF